MKKAIQNVVRSLVPDSILRWRREQRHKRLFGNADYAKAFQIVYDKNLWLNDESRSGGGRRSILQQPYANSFRIGSIVTA